MSQQVRESMPGARKTPGVAVGRSLLPSPEEWAVRNRELTRNLVELINDYAPESTHRALDVGCQWGVMLDNLAQRTSPRWWGVDPVVERHFSRRGFELVPGTAGELPFVDRAFDCVVLANVYEHIPPSERDASLREMRRVLAPGGVIVGQLPNPHFPIESHSKLPLMGYLPAAVQNVYWRLSPSRRGAGFHSVTMSHLARRARARPRARPLVRRYTYPPEAAPESIRWLVRALRRPMSVLPWSWQFVLRRPAHDVAASAPAQRGTDEIFTGEDRWFGMADHEIGATPLATALLGNVRAYRAGRMELMTAVDEALASLQHAAGGADLTEFFNIDAAVVTRAAELARKSSALYRGPEWQWMQEAILRFALQAGRRDSDQPPADRLTLADFRSAA